MLFIEEVAQDYDFDVFQPTKVGVVRYEEFAVGFEGGCGVYRVRGFEVLNCPETSGFSKNGLSDPIKLIWLLANKSS